MSYTDLEIQNAVEKLVRTSIRYEYDVLGTRRSDLSFDDLKDAAAGLFMSRRESPFYLVGLARDRLNELIDEELEQINSFISAVRATGYTVHPLERLNSLANAKVALGALGTAAESRTSTYDDIEQVPAFQRFELNADKFLQNEGNKLKRNGEVGQAPDEARAELRSNAVALREAHDGVYVRTAYIQNAISDYEALDLPSKISREILENATNQLGSLIDELEQLTPKERLVELRGATLDVLASKAVVRGFGSLPVPGLFAVLNGTGQPYADDSHPANSAVLQGDLDGPYIVIPEEDTLTFEVDGVHSLAIQLAGSYLPRLDFLLAEPYDIDGSINEFKITKTYVEQTGSSSQNITLSTGTTQTAYDLRSDMATPADNLDMEAILDILSPKFIGNVDISGTTFTLIAGEWDDYGVVAGDRFVIYDDTSANQWSVYDVTSTSGANAYTSLVHGSSGTELDKSVKVGEPVLSNGSANYICSLVVKQQAVYWRAALTDRWIVTLEDVDSGTLTNLGSLDLAQVEAIKTSSKDLVAAFNANTGASVGLEAKVAAATTFNALHEGMSGRFNPTDPSKLVLYTQRTEVTVVSGGTSAVFDVPELSSSVQVGDWLVMREADTEAEVNNWGVITDITGTQVTATMNVSVTTTGTILMELGKDYQTAIGGNSTVIVNEGTLSDGEYLVRRFDEPFEMTLANPPLVTTDLGGQPITFSDASMGFYGVYFSSLSTGLDTAITIDSGADDASGEFFTSVPKSVVGTTEWYQLSELPTDLSIGDTLELYTVFNAPDFTSAVTNLEDPLIKLGTAISVDEAQVSFTRDSPVPFGRLRKTDRNNYDELEEGLQSWFSSTFDVEQYFRKLDGYLNPLIVNLNPKASDVNDAITWLSSLQTTLESLQQYLAAYEVEAVPEADKLIKSYTNEGADRAVDLLLQARFSEFFDLTQDTCSYLGNVKAAVKNVAVNDLPIRKDIRAHRDAAPAEEIVASWDDVDYEFVPEDVDPVDGLDIPTLFDVELDLPT